MSLARPVRQIWRRRVGFALGVVVVIWLPFEDAGPTSALLLSLLAGLWAGLKLAPEIAAPDCRRIWLAYPLTAIFCGLLVPGIAAFLMVFKSGLHGHGFPDFSIGQLTRTLSQAPLTAGGALLIGLGLALWRWAGCQENADPEHNIRSANG